MTRPPVYAAIRSTHAATPRGPALLWYSLGEGDAPPHWHAIRRAEGTSLCGERAPSTEWHCYATRPSNAGGATICAVCATTAQAPQGDLAADLAAAHGKRMFGLGGKRKRK